MQPSAHYAGKQQSIFTVALFCDLPKIIAELCQFTFLPKSFSNEMQLFIFSENSYLISSGETHCIKPGPSKAPVQISTCN